MHRLRDLWQEIRYGLWFVPAMLVLAGVALAVALVELDSRVASGTFAAWPRLFGSGAAGARGLLSTVASSMITVAGVVFSITLVALTLASSQYTSRVLRNFTSDRVNQSVLGAFLGIFAYCLVVLRTIRGGDEGAFVPRLAVLGGMVLAFVGIALLVYFIHHIARSIQASQLLAAVAAETLRTIDRLFPPGAAGERPPAHPAAPGPAAAANTVLADQTGYLRSLDDVGLVAFANERDAVVRVERRIGEFVIEGAPVLSVPGVVLDERHRQRLRALFAVGPQRTIEQDAAFGIRQIVDVALKALSRGVNDTTTAVMCLDHLTAILVRLAPRRFETQRCGVDGRLRLATSERDFADLVHVALDQIRQNAAGNAAVLRVLFGTIATVAERAPAERRTVLAAQAQAVQWLVRASVAAPCDRGPLEELGARVLAALGGTDGGAAAGAAQPDPGRSLSRGPDAAG